MSPDTPVGYQEIADLFDVPIRTVHMWRHRGELPAADWTVHGLKTWRAQTIVDWAASRPRNPLKPKRRLRVV